MKLKFKDVQFTKKETRVSIIDTYSCVSRYVSKAIGNK